MSAFLSFATACLILGFPADEAASGAEAFFLVQGVDLRGERSIDLQRYKVLVCNPSLDPERVRVRAAPGALLLGYVNPHQVPQWGRRMAFFDRYRAALDDDSYYWRDENGERASIYPNTLELRPLPEVAQELADFVSAEYRRWDGVFLDELWGEFPDWALERLPGLAPSAWDSVRADWAKYRDFFVSRLTLAPDQVLVANVGREPEAIHHLGLDGITIEHEHLRCPSDALRYAQAFRRYRAEFCITWDWALRDGSALHGITWKQLEATQQHSR